MQNLILIEWDGPYTLKEISTLSNEEIDYGIYQVYGNHLVYGNDSLLYIGRANRQTFYTRLSQHTNWLEKNHSVYVGRLKGKLTPSDQMWEKQINQAEELLIYTHSPAYNTSNINTVNFDRVKNIHVLNFGEFHQLLPEVSGLRWSSDWEDAGIYRWR